jgi:hypothetical protein
MMVVVEAGERERVVADFNPQARRLVTADDTTSVWGPYDREPLPRWTRAGLPCAATQLIRCCRT